MLVTGLDRSLVPLATTLHDMGPLELALFASGVITVLFGIAIAYVAFRGYRRNASRPMLFMAIGFILAVALPGTLSYLTYVLTMVFRMSLGIDYIHLAAVLQVSEIVGMACILYALVMR
ncbi:MAG TPA: hypothetical protein VJ898_02190 [Natrialbaceae archaeon]|nr:hypothetical protein [Natrialbaceae archaeon]